MAVRRTTSADVGMEAMEMFWEKLNIRSISERGCMDAGSYVSTHTWASAAPPL